MFPVMNQRASDVFKLPTDAAVVEHVLLSL